jgi:outer membrane protein assembly factor BamB
MFGNGKVFVSHTHEDNAACAPVLAALDAWQVDYWFDTAQLSAGLELLDNIQRGLQERDIFIRICSPASNASPWMAQEEKLARTLRAPNRGQRRVIALIVKPGYIVSTEEAEGIVIDATQLPQIEWLRQLREALGVPSRERRVNRRAFLGIGISSLAALGGMGLVGKLLFFTPPAPNLYLPVGHKPIPTALPGASRIRWTYVLEPLSFGIPTVVALAGDNVICNNSGFVVALRGSDGKLQWDTGQQYNAINTDAPPTVVGDTVYITFVDVVKDPYHANTFLQAVYLAALSTSDGSEQWRQRIIVDPNDTNKRSAITVAGNMAYIRYNQTLYAFDVTTGKMLWSQSAGNAPRFDEVLPAPTAAGDRVFVVLGDRKLHAFSAISGSPLWPAPFAFDMPIHTQPVLANGTVYVATDGGWGYALDATTGAVRWKSLLLDKADDNFTALGLTLSNNVLYVSGGLPLQAYDPNNSPHGGSLQALDAATGKILWSSAPDQQVPLSGLQADILPASALVAGNDLLIATRLHAQTGKNVNILFALDKTTGKASWNVEMWGGEDVAGPSAFPSAPVISDNTLYIASGHDTIYAIATAD